MSFTILRYGLQLPGETIAYTIVLKNTGTAPATSSITDTPPLTLTVDPASLSASDGLTVSYDANSRQITWTGTLPVSGEVLITYTATPYPGLPWLTPQENTVLISGSVLGDFSRSAAVTQAYGTWLPMLMK